MLQKEIYRNGEDQAWLGEGTELIKGSKWDWQRQENGGRQTEAEPGLAACKVGDDSKGNTGVGSVTTESKAAAGREEQRLTKRGKTATSTVHRL